MKEGKGRRGGRKEEGRVEKERRKEGGGKWRKEYKGGTLREKDGKNEAEEKE